MRRLVILLAMGLCTGQGYAQTPDLTRVVGTWARPRNSGGWLYETWALALDSSLVGRAFVHVDGRSEEHREYLRIERFADTWVYLARPRGAEPTLFWWDAQASDSTYWVFRNPEHDYPKRIVYNLREAGKLTAWIDDGDNATEDRIEFRFSRKDDE